MKAAGVSDVPIPRRDLFADPLRARLRLSPRGDRLAFVAPRDEVLNVFAAPLDDVDASRVISECTGRGVYQFEWAFDACQLLWLEDSSGNEEWSLFSGSGGGRPRRLTPPEGCSCKLLALSPERPQEIAVGLNMRDRRFHDIYRLSLLDGRLTLLCDSNVFFEYAFDGQLEPRLAQKMESDGSIERFIREADGSWTRFSTIPACETLNARICSLSSNGRTLYETRSDGPARFVLRALDLATGRCRVMGSTALGEFSDVLLHPVSRAVQAASIECLRREWVVFDRDLAASFTQLTHNFGGDFVISSRSLDDTYWIVEEISDRAPRAYHLLCRRTHTLRPLGSSRPALLQYRLRPMRPLVLKARDGFELPSYLTLPKCSGGRSGDHPPPLIVSVHGGPWSRDHWGCDVLHQWLGSRGYAVLSVNFRGSVGFGCWFTAAGDREWGGRMQDDLEDAVNWVLRQGLADRRSVGIMGMSYGGYASLMSLVRAPSLFSCAISLCGPTDLVAFLKSIPEYWRPQLGLLTARVGDPTTPAGVSQLLERSPSCHVGEIRAPVLLVHGERDPRVRLADVESFAASLEEAQGAVTFLAYAKEGHGLLRSRSRLSFYGIAEAFLAQHLSGAMEPLGADWDPEIMSVMRGAARITVLRETGL